jgi:hypothetical protein
MAESAHNFVVKVNPQILDQTALRRLENAKNVEIMSEEDEGEDLFSKYKLLAMISNAEKDKLLKAIINRVPLVAFESDFSEHTLCGILDRDLSIGACLPALYVQSSEAFKESLGRVMERSRDITLNLDIHYE